jgi:hypothetical protein
MVLDLNVKTTTFYWNGVSDRTSPVWGTSPTQLTGFEVHRHERTNTQGQYVHLDNLFIRPSQHSWHCWVSVAGC